MITKYGNIEDFTESKGISNIVTINKRISLNYLIIRILGLDRGTKIRIHFNDNTNDYLVNDILSMFDSDNRVSGFPFKIYSYEDNDFHNNQYIIGLIIRDDYINKLRVDVYPSPVGVEYYYSFEMQYYEYTSHNTKENNNLVNLPTINIGNKRNNNAKDKVINNNEITIDIVGKPPSSISGKRKVIL